MSDGTIDMPEEPTDRCGTCHKPVKWVKENPDAGWLEGKLVPRHYDREANADHDAWVRA